MANTGLFQTIGNGIVSLWNKFTGAGKTTAQQEQEDYQTQMSNTAFQRQVADMRKAGLNPAMMYGSGAGAGASTPAGSDASSNGADLGSMISLMMAGKQMKLLDAQVAKTHAEAGQIDRNTAWIDRLNEGQLQQIASQIGLNEAEINAREYDNALKTSQVRQIEKETEWIDRINSAKTDAEKARAAHEWAEAAISKVEKEMGHRLSSSNVLAIIDALSAAIHRSGNNLPKPDEVLEPIVEAGKDYLGKVKDGLSHLRRGAEIVARRAQDGLTNAFEGLVKRVRGR